jgi:hypothetical protein
VSDVYCTPVRPGWASHVCLRSIGVSSLSGQFDRSTRGTGTRRAAGQARGGVAYEELLQAGCIGLWQAVLHFDPHRSIAFSTYAWVTIQRHIWRAVAQANRPQANPPLPRLSDPLDVAEENLW